MNKFKKQLVCLRLKTLRGGAERAKYLKSLGLFKNFGDNCYYQPYKIPTQPNLVKIGNNVNIGTQVLFMEHDIIHRMLNIKNKTTKFREKLGTIEIGDNVFIGANSIILYNTKIGNNVIIGAGSIVSKDIPDNSVAVGVPAKVIGEFKDVEKKYEEYANKIGNANLYDKATQNKIFWSE